jgi:hypothetical protein
MRDYGKVYTAFWTSEDVLAMSEDERTLALYLLTCPHGNMLGCFRLPNAYASDDLKWDMERVSKGFSGLVAKGYIYRCERSFWLVIKRYLKWNQFENPNVGKAAGKLFDTLGAPTTVKACLAAALRDFAPTFPTSILDNFEAENEPFRNPSVLSPETGAVAVTGTRAETGAEDTSAKIAAAAPDDSDLVDAVLESVEESKERREKRRATEADEKCARWCFGLILDNNPTAKAPNFQSWAEDVRLMRERDHRKLPDVCELFRWAQADDFWCGNILSPAKLREKWDQLTIQRQRGRGKPAGLPAPIDIAAARQASNAEAKRRLGFADDGADGEVIDAAR